MVGRLILEDGSKFEGKSFGSSTNCAGEVVFSTGMVGYPESLTDPSFKGQILILTYPLIGNYGTPDKIYWESESIQITGLLVSNYIDTPSHFQSKKSLSEWLKSENIPALEVTDTRHLAQKIRSNGTMLGKITFQNDLPFYNPDKVNLVAFASTKTISSEGKGKKTVILIDCGAKRNIKKCLLKRGIHVITVPWDFDPYIANNWRALKTRPAKFDAIVISNGPGNPKMVTKTVKTIQKALSRKTPLFGICLGHQLLTLASGGDTAKLKFGHRSQNQPCLLNGTKMCYITSQNHGFSASKIPAGFKVWFKNANDGSNEGIIHQIYPFMSVQFHPEASPGPTDTEWLFDFFLKRIKD